MMASKTDLQSSTSDGHHEQSGLMQSSHLISAFDSDASKSSYSQAQVHAAHTPQYGPGSLWNNSSLTLATATEVSSSLSSSNDDLQFQLPSFMNAQLYHPVPLKQSILSNIMCLRDTDGNDSASTIRNSSNLGVYNNSSIDYFTPELMDKITTDPFKTKLGYDPTHLESNYAPKKRYTMNQNQVNSNHFSENRIRTVDFKQQPIISQYAPRNPSHGSLGISSQGNISQGSLSQGTASRGNAALLLQYHTSQTSMQSDDDSFEAMKLEILYKEQINKTLDEKFAELKANFDKLKASTESSNTDTIRMPFNVHQLLNDLTRTLNERTLELEETKNRLDAVIVGLVMSKDKTITEHGTFDVQELAHRITSKINVLRSENEALLKMVSFSNKQSLIVELGMLKNENAALKEKLKAISEK